MSSMLDFESQLQTSLKPVNPDGQFVSHLRTRLVTPPDTIFAAPAIESRWASSILLASAIVISSLGFGLLLLRVLFPPAKS